jgi:hypothetical protein
MILGYRLSQVLYVFAELGVADALGAGPASAAVIAEKTRAHEDSLRRILRVSRAMGITEELPDGRFELTRRGRLLCRDADGSQAQRAALVGEPWHWDSWGKLLQTVTTGIPAFEAEYGSNSFEYFDRTPGTGDTMMDRVTLEAGFRGKAIAEAFDFSSVSCLVDVGGGRGAILGEVLSRHQRLGGVLMDLPYAVAGAADLLKGFGVADRCEIVPGDFRLDLPVGGDVCLLSAVLHSWNDDDSVELLRRCLARYGRVIVVDEVIEPAEAPLDTLMKDLQLMVFSGGGHRNLADYRRLFERADAELLRHAPIGGQELLMEGLARSAA